MTKQRLYLMVVVLAAILSTGFVVQGMKAADPASPPARMDTFTHPDGTNYFALSLTPQGVATTTVPRDVVVMFNTSASQMGDYRTKAMAALHGILAGLGPQDRVQLIAVDLNAVPLTKTFVAPGGKELTDALAALDARVPLGATDMKKALAAAADSFQGDAKNARTVVYLGDGRSRANPISSQEFDELANKLASARISVSSYVLGAQPDAQILGSLAGKTGGVMVEYNPAPVDPQTALKMPPTELAASEAAAEKKSIAELAAALNAPVFWPTSVKWPAEMTEVFPKQAPPLRPDRDSVVIGKFKGQGPFEVQYELETPAGPQKVAFTAAPAEASGDKNNYLAAMVQRAEMDGGATLPLIGSRSLEQAKMVSVGNTRNVKELAKQALVSGNVDGAEKLAEAALRQDPNNNEALNLKDAVAKLRQGGSAGKAPAAKAPAAGGAGAVAPEILPPAGGATALNLVGPAAPIEDPNAGAFLEDFQHRSTVITQQVQADVRATVDQARGQVGADPEQAMTNLRLLLEKVRQVPELNPDARDQLVVQLQTALQETSRRQQEFERLQLKQQESIAAAKEQQIIIDNQLRDQMKVKQLMNRFDSLMNEGRYNLAEMAAADEAQKIMPNSPMVRAAKLTARNTDYYSRDILLREQRQKGVVDALASVERAHIPFNDEEPIIYPDAEFWRKISDKANPDSRISKYSSMDLYKLNSAESDIQQALKEKTPPLVFVETQFSEVINYIKDVVKKKHPNFEIQFDTKILNDIGLTNETPVTKNLEGVSLRSALRLLLKDFSATYVIRDEVLLITSQDEADNNLSLMQRKVYPVGDLVIPIRNIGGMGGMGGMMGGMGGMMGGMGGGMGGMGGGMGGMGGGMGGMGGGMGGMGMMNLPREMLPKIPPGGFQAFSVKDDLSTPVKSDLKTSAKSDKAALNQEKVPASVIPATASKAAAAPGEKIQLEMTAGDKPEIVWDKFFSTHAPDQAAVRDAVRRLMNDGKYDHVIAMIGAALRHQQPQPWMYEAMCLAMQAAGRPKAEIERAIMSAVDFAQSTSDLMYIGAYLMNLGLPQRALDVCRQVAAIEPLNPEPYMLGLKAARLTDSLDGLRWASLGILSQAWPKDQASVWRSGLGVAEEVLAKLKAEKRTREADAFRAALDCAVERDCVVIVNYTGDAQLDLVVLEPTGSVCSYRLPRTASGGVLLGDAISQTNNDNGGGKSEVYVCPQGFDGAYRMAIRRVFGNVTTGKVHVKVMTHYLGKNPVSIEKTIPLVKDEAQLVFDLKDGRRKEPIADQQIANAAAAQLQLNAQVQVLAQQLDAAVDPSALGALAAARSSSGVLGGNGANGGLGGIPFFAARGAVGYQPVITQYPEGASMSATAVISADRRYVRVTAAPIFSGIGQVNTFNTSTGAGGQTSGGTGGQGFGGLSGGQTTGSTGGFSGGGSTTGSGIGSGF